MDYNPIVPDIQKIIQLHAHLLRSSPELLEIFPSKSIFPTYHRTKNLKDILAPSKNCGDTGVDRAESETRGCFKCSSKCDLCKNFLIQDSMFKSFSTGRTQRINQNLSCSSKNVVYLTSWNKCYWQYVGSTSTEFKVHFRNHKSSMLTNKKNVSLQSISIVPSTWLLKLVLLLLRKLLARGMQLILINCYSQEKLIGPLNCAHLILAVSKNDANLDMTKNRVRSNT